MSSEFRFRKLSELRPVSPLAEADSVERRRKRTFAGNRNNMELLIRCEKLWSNLHTFREERERCLRYTFGEQWSDIITYKGKRMTEKEYLKEKGNIPLVNNLIIGIVNSVVGLYTNSETEPVAKARAREEQKIGEMMSATIQANWQKNKMPILLANLLMDYVIGGGVFEKESWVDFNGNFDVMSTVPNPNNMIFDSAMSDPLFRDLSLIGEIHDISFNDLAEKFCKSMEDYNLLTRIYANQRDMVSTYGLDPTKKNRTRFLSFYGPIDNNLCRVFEIWTKETKARYRVHDPMTGSLYKIEIEDYDNMVEAVNEERRRMGIEAGMNEEEIPYLSHEFFVDSYWFYQFLAPDGTILAEGENPYWHESHPYTMTLYPFVNGEIHSFVSNFIDQQRYVNRLIMIDDFVRRSGAKGVTMVPEQLIPDGMDINEFAEQWSAVDGLIVYKAREGVPEPKQFYSSSVNLNTAELVQMQISLMDEITNVHGAMRGKTPYSGTSANLYAQQTQNSTSSLSALLLRFNSFTQDISMKKGKMIQQFYDEKRNIEIGGKMYSGIKEYDPSLARDMEFNMSIVEGAATPTKRMLANDTLLTFWEKGAITIEMLLENGDFPFADQLLQSIQAAKEAAQQQNIPQNIGDAQLQNVKQFANQNAVNDAQKMLMAA